VSPDLLLVAAFHPELAPLRAHLGDGMSGVVGRTLVAARVVGIGMPMAAAGVVIHAGELRPRAVLAVGTCGAYASSGLSIGDVVVASGGRLVDPSALEGRSEFPAPMQVAFDAHETIAESIVRETGARRAAVASTLGITVNNATAARIALTTGTNVEHLETHGMAMACAALGVPFGAVLAIANFVGTDARAEWRLHHLQAAARAAETVVQWLLSAPRV
jgi:nucleoside phosphorylase